MVDFQLGETGLSTGSLLEEIDGFLVFLKGKASGFKAGFAPVPLHPGLAFGDLYRTVLRVGAGPALFRIKI